MKKGKQMKHLTKEEFIKIERKKARRLKDTRWWRRKLEKGICYYCGRKVSREELTMDHKIPLALGGTSSRENIVLACKECNTKKKSLPPWEWEEYLTKLKGQRGGEEFEGCNPEG